jgi:hypothetical protein
MKYWHFKDKSQADRAGWVVDRYQEWSLDFLLELPAYKLA